MTPTAPTSTPQVKKSPKVLFLLIFLILIVVLFSSLGTIHLGSKAVSPNILDITQPVFSITGKIEKIDGNTLNVSYQVAPNVPVAPALPSKNITPAPLKTISYKVTVGKSTQISSASQAIPYAFKQITPGSSKVSLSDLSVGETVIVTSATDLRMLSQNQFEATMIGVSSAQNTLNGTIESVSGSQITLKASAVTPTGPQIKDYTVTVNNDTEITRTSPSSPKPEKISLSDLKKDMTVVVFADKDVSSSPLVALKIDVLPPPPSAGAAILPSGAPANPPVGAPVVPLVTGSNAAPVVPSISSSPPASQPR